MNTQQLYDKHILYRENNDLILNTIKYDKWLSLISEGYSNDILMLYFKEYFPNDNIIYLFKNGRKIDLSQLKILWLHDNKLSSLSVSIGALTQLETLSLSYNNLSILPDSISNLSHLRVLYLWSNKLSILPESIGNLTELKLLDLNDNKISKQEQEKIKKLFPNTQISF